MALDDREWYREELRRKRAAGDPGIDWYDPKQFRGLRHRSADGSTARAAVSLASVVATVLSLLLTVRHGLNEGWPDRLIEAVGRRQAVVFPESGSVQVMPVALRATKMVPWSIIGDPKRHSVLRLTDADTGEYVMSVYVRRAEQVEVPVPAGRYRLDIASGSTWYGRRALFGFDEQLERAYTVQEFTPDAGRVLDLRRTLAGNMPTAVEGERRFHEQAVR